MVHLTMKAVCPVLFFLVLQLAGTGDIRRGVTTNICCLWSMMKHLRTERHVVCIDHARWWPNCRWDGTLSVFAVYASELYIRVEG